MVLKFSEEHYLLVCIVWDVNIYKYEMSVVDG